VSPLPTVELVFQTLATARKINGVVVNIYIAFVYNRDTCDHVTSSPVCCRPNAKLRTAAYWTARPILVAYWKRLTVMVYA